MNAFIKSLSLALLLLHGFTGSLLAQTAEETRAGNWLALQQLLFTKASAPWALSAAELHRIDSIQNASPLDVCANVTQALCSNTSPLPVRELKLKGQRLNAQKAGLRWETIGEYNSRVFVIERQSFSLPNQFDSVGFMPAAGTSYGKLKYESVDLNSHSEPSYYRIKEMDDDGKFMYSNLVRIAGATGVFEVNVVPNPSNGSNLRFYFTTTTPAETIDFTVSNNIGVVFIKKEKFDGSSGYYEVPGHSLAPGSYFIAVRTNESVYTKQFVIIN